MPKVVEINPLPDWLDRELWTDFLQYRKEIDKRGVGLSPTGEKRALMKLERFIRDGGDQTLILENTITSKTGWAGIFMAKKDVDINLNSDIELNKFCEENGISTIGRSRHELRDRVRERLNETQS